MIKTVWETLNFNQSSVKTDYAASNFTKLFNLGCWSPYCKDEQENK